MIPRSKTRMLAIAAAALVALALVLWGYSAHQQRKTARAIVALITDTSARLRDALGIETAPPTLERASFLKKLDEHAATAEHNLQALKRLDAGSNRALADAADDYLVTAREILKRQAESRRYRLSMAESERALRDHMRSRDRSAAWVQEAVRAKERFNKDFRGYSSAAGIFEKLLGSYPASQEKIAPHVAPTALIDRALIGDVRDRVQKDSKQTAAEFEKLSQVETFR